MSQVYKYRLLHLCPQTGRWHEWKPKLMHHLPKACPECKARLHMYGGKHVVCDPISVIFFYRDKELEIYGWKNCPEEYKKTLQKAVKERETVEK